MKCLPELLTKGRFTNITYYEEYDEFDGEFTTCEGHNCEMCETTSLSDLVWFLIHIWEVEGDEEEVHSKLLVMAEDYFDKFGEII